MNKRKLANEREKNRKSDQEQKLIFKKSLEQNADNDSPVKMPVKI